MATKVHPERYWLTYVFAVSLTAAVAAYGGWGWVQANEPFKAILCLVAQGLANGNTVLARRAFAKDRPVMALVTLGLAFGCGTWSAISLHHAWTLHGSDIHWSMTAFLALLEPIMFWVVEEVKSAQPVKSATELADEALAGLRADPVQRRAGLRSIAGGLTGAAAIALAPGSAQASEPVAPQPVTQKASRSTLQAISEPARAEAKLLLAQGRTAYSVHKATGVPLSTLKRWAKAA